MEVCGPINVCQILELQREGLPFWPVHASMVKPVLLLLLLLLQKLTSKVQYSKSHAYYQFTCFAVSLFSLHFTLFVVPLPL